MMFGLLKQLLTPLIAEPLEEKTGIRLQTITYGRKNNLVLIQLVKMIQKTESVQIMNQRKS